MARSVVTGSRLRSTRIATTTQVGAGFVTRLEGVEEAIAKIEDLIDRTSAQRLKGLFMQVGAIVQARVKANAPYSGDKQRHKDWAHLRDAVFLSEGKPTASNVIVGISHKRAPQGLWVEYGTSHSAAHPFFRPAITQVRGEVAEELARGLKEEIEAGAK